MKRSRAAIGTAVVTSTLTSLAMLATSPAANAAAASEPIATNLAGPLQMDVDTSRGEPRVVVAQSFAGLLSRVKEDGSTKVLHAEEGGEVAGVAINGKEIAFLTTSQDHENPAAFLKLRKADGTVRKIANLHVFEDEANPDGEVVYGIRKLDQECSDQIPEEAFGIAPYSGIVESHPYALDNAPGGGWYVADAAGNTILKVGRKGAVRTVAVLRPQKVVVTAEAAEANGLPECTVGKTAFFEPVPTDVEVDRTGDLVVSLLPGGPEDPSFGARGSVVRVDPATGRSEQLADGFAAASNVAVAGRRVFVSELFGGQITKIKPDGRTRPFFEAQMPAAIEWVNGAMYAAIDVFNEEDGGSIVIITPAEQVPVVD